MQVIYDIIVSSYFMLIIFSSAIIGFMIAFFVIKNDK
jgi:hypothetical protein